MSDPRQLTISDYTYELPDERIARHPVEIRDQSKLLVYQTGTITDASFHQLPDVLPEGTLLVFNNTKVIHARLQFQRETGALIEVLCLEPLNAPDPATALGAKGTCMWKAFAGNAKRWKIGEKLIAEFPSAHGTIKLTATLLNRIDEQVIVGLFWEPFHLSMADVLDAAGTLPLPPYLNRQNVQEDEERYQTVYAQFEGSVAAPTAGLHFTFETLDRLSTQSVGIAEITLHVGAGTFKPVTASALGEHRMHEEMVHIPKETIELLLHQIRHKKKIAMVGTTACRTIESLYWHGVQLIHGKAPGPLQIDQWMAVDHHHETIDPEAALQQVLQSLESGSTALHGSTSLMITPGYQFRLTDILITNFHQPGSTLILLVAAFLKKDWRMVYDHALQHDYRFLSYGDSSILFRPAS